MTSVSTSAMDFDRFFELARVLPAEPIERLENKSNLRLGPASYPLMICYPEKMVREAVNLFATRFNMHQQVYTHQGVKEIEYMITDALEMADPFLRIQGSISVRFPDGLYKISEAICDMRALSNLNDSVVELILASTDARLNEAQQLLHRIYKRQLYRCVGKTSITGDVECRSKSESEILDEIISKSEEIILEGGGSSTYQFGEILQYDITPENLTYLEADDYGHVSAMRGSAADGFVRLEQKDLIVEKMHIHYGMKAENPVARLRFYPKNAVVVPPVGGGDASLSIARQLDERVYNTLLPRSFEDRSVRVFCRYPEKEQAAIHAFERWCSDRNSHLPFPSLSQPDCED
jgi:deoxynucleoside triphosphate triphosphohydrolase SAMHD1